MALLQKQQAPSLVGEQKQYLDTVKRLIHTALQSGGGVFGGNLQDKLDRLNDQIKEKYDSISADNENAEASDLDEDNSGEDNGPLDNLTKNLNDALSKYVDQQLNMVLEEAKKGIEELEEPQVSGEISSDQGSPESSVPEAPECQTQQSEDSEELKSFATAEELEEADQSKEDKRYLPPSVQKAPDWMNLEEGQIFIDQDGNIFVKDGPEDIEGHLDLEGEALRYQEESASDGSDSKIVDYDKIRSNFFAQQDASAARSVSQGSSAGSEEDIDADTFEIPKIRLDIKSLTPVDDSLDMEDSASVESAKYLPSDSVGAKSDASSGDHGKAKEAGEPEQGSDSLHQEMSPPSNTDSLPHSKSAHSSAQSSQDKDEL